MFNWIVPRNRNYNNRVAKCQHYRASWSCGLNVWTCNWTELRSYSERVQEDLNLAWCMMNFSENRWKLNAVCSRHSPTGQQGSGALLAGGWVAREACATHPPASRAQNPCWRVGEWRGRLAQLTHRPAGNPPLSGVLPLCSVGRTQLP